MSTSGALVRATRTSRLTSLHPVRRPTQLFNYFRPSVTNSTRLFSQARIVRMPETLHQSEVSSKTDPSVSKQYDDQTPKDQQIKDLYEIADKLKIAILSTHRDGIGLVGRSMAIASRRGPDFLFLANAHSRKFKDLAKNTQVQLTFQDSKTQDWISISGTATTTSNTDPRIKEIWSQGTRVWFGDLGDGIHTGGPEDPRMTLIEVKSGYVVYYKTDVGALGFVKEVVGAAVTGGVANTGKLREVGGQDLERARGME